jgi:hypothetical protein
MRLSSSSECLQIEAWLAILINTYKDHPNFGLAKTINYYLERLLHHDDINFCKSKRCEYIAMQKFWHWKVSH